MCFGALSSIRRAISSLEPFPGKMCIRDRDDTDIDEKYNRAKMLSQPLTVCTVDQLFKFVYKALGTEILAATLKYSKLILDEDVYKRQGDFCFEEK